MNKKIFSVNSMMLLLAAAIWGIAFVAQSAAMDSVQPFTFNCIRSFLGGAVLVPCIFLLDKINKNGRQVFSLTKGELVGGVVCGLVLGVASSLQQYGIALGSTAGKAAFITSLYVVLVPVFSAFVGKKIDVRVWLGVFMALVGVGLISINFAEGFSVGIGDLLVLGCAICFAFHIIVIDKFSVGTDGVRMSMVQFFVASLVNLPGMLIFDRPEPSCVMDAWLPIAYAGFLSCGVAYTLQVVGQKKCHPVAATAILSLESVFGAVGGAIILGVIGGSEADLMKWYQIIGCVIVFSAVIITQLFVTPKQD